MNALPSDRMRVGVSEAGGMAGGLVGGALGALGGAALIGAMVSNPVGWAVLGASFVGGLLSVVMEAVGGENIATLPIAT